MGDGKLLTWPWMEILQPWKRCNKRKGVWQCGKRLPQGRTLRMQHHPRREYHPHHRQGERTSGWACGRDAGSTAPRSLRDTHGVAAYTLACRSTNWASATTPAP